jgi:hypothetical protein
MMGIVDVWGRGFWWHSLRERDHLEDLRMDGVCDYVGLAQDMDKWQELVNTVINIWVP